MLPRPTTRARIAAAASVARACAAVTSAVTKRSRTVKAHGLKPSATPATTMVPSVRPGSRLATSAAGARTEPRPTSAASPSTATAASAPATTRPGRILRLHDQLAAHRRVRAPAAAHVAVVLVDAGRQRERRLPRVLRRGDDVHAEGVDRELVLAPAVRVERGVHAGEAHGQRAPGPDPDLRGGEAAHRPLDLDELAAGRARRHAVERRRQDPHDADDRGGDDQEEGAALPPLARPCLRSLVLHPSVSRFEVMMRRALSTAPAATAAQRTARLTAWSSERPSPSSSRSPRKVSVTTRISA